MLAIIIILAAVALVGSLLAVRPENPNKLALKYASLPRAIFLESGASPVGYRWNEPEYWN